MHLQQVQQQIGVLAVILGPRAIKRPAQVGGHGWRNRIDVQPLIFAQQKHQGSTGLLHRYRNRTLTKSLAHLHDPRFNRFWCLLYLPTFPPCRIGALQAPDMLLVRPIDRQESCKLRLLLVFFPIWHNHWLLMDSFLFRDFAPSRRLSWLLEILIAESCLEPDLI